MGKNDKIQFNVRSVFDERLWAVVDRVRGVCVFSSFDINVVSSVLRMLNAQAVIENQFCVQRYDRCVY